MKIVKTHFGIWGDRDIYQFSLSNDNDMEIRVINYGGIVTHINIPDVKGDIIDVSLGFDNLDPYLEDHPFFGAIVGRYGNRIAYGAFKLGEKEYQLPINNGPHCLHGGFDTFAHRYWEVEEISIQDQIGLKLSLLSPHNDQGFPGSLTTEIFYLLDNDNYWTIKYRVTTDMATVVNLTQHTYFNLNGQGSGQVLDHELWIDADQYTPVDDTMIPTGEIYNVVNTPFDFRDKHKIGLNMNGGLDPMIAGARGYDLNYVLNGKPGNLRTIAEAYGEKSGIRMEVLTTEPGAQLYIGNWLDGIRGKKGSNYQPYHGFCIETQHYPDAPNQPHFPSTVLQPDEIYESETRYQFFSEKK